MKLNKQQEEALPHLKWLFNTQSLRASGRSFLMAVTIIEIARESGRAKVTDLSTALHYPREFSYRDKMIHSVIENLIKEMYPNEVRNFTYNRSENELRYHV